MYQVAVYEFHQSSNEWNLIEIRQFPFGKWNEIGFWLSDSELIEPNKYKVHINFIDAP